MSAVEGWGGHLIFPITLLRAVDKDAKATVKVLRKTKTRTYLQTSIPSMQRRGDVFDVRRNANVDAMVSRLAGREVQS